MVERNADGTVAAGSVLNPTGRPKKQYSITAFLREIGEEVVDGETKETRAQRLARKLWTMAEDGDRAFAQYLVDRLDGKPKERIEKEGETVVRIVFDDGPETNKAPEAT